MVLCRQIQLRGQRVLGWLCNRHRVVVFLNRHLTRSPVCFAYRVRRIPDWWFYLLDHSGRLQLN